MTTGNDFLGATSLSLENASDGEEWYDLGWHSTRLAEKEEQVSGRILVELKGINIQRKEIQDAARTKQAKAG